MIDELLFVIAKKNPGTEDYAPPSPASFGGNEALIHLINFIRSLLSRTQDAKDRVGGRFLQPTALHRHLGQNFSYNLLRHRVLVHVV